MEKLNNEYFAEISNLKNLVEEKDENYKNQIDKYTEVKNNLEGIKEKNERLIRENLKQNDEKTVLENELNKLKMEKRIKGNEENIFTFIEIFYF